MTRARAFLRVATIAVPLVVAIGCAKTDTTPAVAKVSLSLNRTTIALGGVIDLTYRFQVAPDAKLSGDYRVFVHLNREDGTIIWTDDHDLPEQFRTSRWQPGQTIEYTRTRFVPTVAYVGPATIEMGLYRDDERLRLEGPNAADRDSPARAYKVASLELQPKSEAIQIARLSGWFGAEYAPEDPTVDWQWTQKVAVLGVKNPKRDVTFYLDYDARSDAFAGHPQQVTIYCGDVKLATFAADSHDRVMQRIPVTAAQLGAGDMVQFRIEVDRTFIPAQALGSGSDARELGIRVYHAAIE